MRYIFCLILMLFALVLNISAQTEDYDLVYSEYVNPSESFLIQQAVDGESEVLMTIIYPTEFDALIHSPLNGIYQIKDNQAFLEVAGELIPQFDFPLIETVDHIREMAVNMEAYPDLAGTVFTNSAILSHNEEFIGFDMTTLDEMGRIVDEFIAVYHVASATLRIVEVEDPDIMSIGTIDNLRWSPDDTVLAFYYPTGELTATEHITLVTGCVTDIQVECEVECLDLPPEAPVMESFDWSPDGSQFAVSCAVDHLDPDDICIVNRDGTLDTIYDVADDTHKFSVEWSPDGTWIAYTAQNLSFTQQDIFILNLATGEELNVSLTEDALESVPFWVKSSN